MNTISTVILFEDNFILRSKFVWKLKYDAHFMINDDKIAHNVLHKKNSIV